MSLTNIPYALVLYTMNSNDTIITTKKAAKLLGVSQSRIRQLIRDGKINAFKVDGSMWLISLEDFNLFSAKARRAGRPRREDVSTN